MSWKKLLESVSESLNDHVRLRNDYLMAENRVLRNQTVTWRELVRSHWDVLLATDFFNSEEWSWFGLIISYLSWFVHVVYRRTCSVIILLQHHMPGLKSLVIRFGEASLKPTVSELAPFDEGHPQFPDKGKVVVVPAVYPGPIRDGPIQRQQRFKSLSKDNQRKAA